MRRDRYRALLVLSLVLLTGGCSTSSGEIRAVKILEIQVGQCVIPPKLPRAELSVVAVVGCNQRHTQEAFALARFVAPIVAASAENYPGTEVLKRCADGACAQQFGDYVGVAYADSSLFFTYLLPSPRSWSSSEKDRTVTCFVTTTGASLTKSVKGSRL